MLILVLHVTPNYNALNPNPKRVNRTRRARITLNSNNRKKAKKTPNPKPSGGAREASNLDVCCIGGAQAVQVAQVVQDCKTVTPLPQVWQDCR